MEGGIVAEGWWLEIAASVLTVILAGLGLLIRKLVNSLVGHLDRSNLLRQVMDLLMGGIAEAETELVRTIKESSKDGKLTKNEVRQVERYAIDKARSLATGPAKDLLINTSEEVLRGWIKNLVQKVDKERPNAVAPKIDS